MNFEAENSAHHTKSPTPPCGNCKTEFPNDLESTSVLKIASIANAEEIDIQILDAIVHMYGISWDEFQCYVRENISGHNSTDSTNIWTSQTILLCPCCSSLLSESYRAHLKFEEATNSKSVIQQMKDSRRKISILSSVNLTDTNENTIGCNNSTGNSNTNKKVREKILENFDDAKEQTELDSDIKSEPPENDELNEMVEVVMDDSEEYVKAESCSSVEWDELHENVGECEENGSSDEFLPGSTELILKIQRISAEEMKKYAKRSNKEEQRKIEETRRKLRKKLKKGKSTSTGKRQRDARSKWPSNAAEYLQNGEYVCPICNKSFKDPGYLRWKHLALHNSPKTVSCTLCGKELSTNRNLKRHVFYIHGDVHENEITKSCAVCGKGMRSDSLPVHMQMIHGERESRKCGQCGKEYIYRDQYEAHLLTHEEDFVPFQCHHCGQTFTNRHTFSVHQKRHTKEKKFACEKCPSRFYAQRNLNEHQRVHSSERPFVCEQCGKGFKISRSFKRHLQIHEEIAQNGEYSFTCDVCGKMCKNSVALDEHKRIWHGKNTFQCSFCGKRLLCSSSLEKHENLHKINPDYKPKKEKKVTMKPKMAAQR